MVEQFLRFIDKHPHRDRFLKAIYAIYENNFEWYDHKPLAGKPWFFRIRLWWVRIIYQKTAKRNHIFRIWNRWDVYNNF